MPADAVTASASGLDPHISPAYAELQVRSGRPRERAVRGRGPSLVEENTDGRGAGFLGEPGVNVLKLNVAVQAAER